VRPFLVLGVTGPAGGFGPRFGPRPDPERALGNRSLGAVSVDTLVVDPVSCGEQEGAPCVGVSAVGASSFSIRKVRTGLVALVALGGTAFYFYGPAVTPVLHSAAAAECNDLIGGNYRSYQLQWVVGSSPRWMCSNRHKPAEKAVDMGWWVTPGF
jgi:hypothetical protein